MQQRQELIEPLCGTLQRSMDQGYLRLRTRKKVAAEMRLTVLAYNRKRVIAILGGNGRMAGMLDRLARRWYIMWWLSWVPWWRKRISRVVWRGRMPAHQPTFHTV